MSLTKSEIRDLREQSQKKLNDLQEEMGFKLTLGNASFTGESVTFKLDCGRIKEDGTAATKESQDFLNLAEIYGLKGTDLGRTFKGFDGNYYTIVGLNRKAHKMPIVCKRADGKLYKMSAIQVKHCLTIAK